MLIITRKVGGHKKCKQNTHNNHWRVLTQQKNAKNMRIIDGEVAYQRVANDKGCGGPRTVWITLSTHMCTELMFFYLVTISMQLS